MDLLRINTAGSVDDGKSTLIGRLLHDCGALTIEQEELVARKTAEKGMEDLDLSVLTDGLIAEREQGITIDVAHIYFSSESRRFIIADSPGHVEYTRNMVTGASNSEVSIILIDARKGLLEQSFRHYYISLLLRVPSVIFCINKMDLVGYSEDVFLEIAAQVEQMVGQVPGWRPSMEVVPISGLKGDNVVSRSIAMPWYQGPTLHDLLHAPRVADGGELPLRFEVQQVFHVQNEEFVDFRGFAGRVASGKVRLGDAVEVSPGGRQANVVEIRRYHQVLPEAEAGDSIVIRLDAEIDASRGSLITRVGEVPNADRELEVHIVWLDERAAQNGGRYILQAGVRQVQVRLEALNGRIDPRNPAELLPAEGLKLNDIASVRLKLAQPANLDPYSSVKANGAFILIDPASNNTSAVGFVASGLDRVGLLCI